MSCSEKGIGCLCATFAKKVLFPAPLLKVGTSLNTWYKPVKRYLFFFFTSRIEPKDLAILKKLFIQIACFIAAEIQSSCKKRIVTCGPVIARGWLTDTHFNLFKHF